MKVDCLDPTPGGRYQFHMRDRRRVPDQSGCYVLTAFDGTVLYIGLAKSLRTRFFQHLENPEKRVTAGGYRATLFYFYEAAESELNRLERTWLQQHVAEEGVLPVLNKVESPMSY